VTTYGALLRPIPLRRFARACVSLFARVVIGYFVQLPRLCKDATAEPSVWKPRGFLARVIAVQKAAIQESDDLFALC